MLTYNLRLYWRDTHTTAEGVYTCDWPYPAAEVNEYTSGTGRLPFIWSEGNFSCDCNMAIFFLGHDIEDVTCGDERFEILKWEWAPVEGL